MDNSYDKQVAAVRKSLEQDRLRLLTMQPFIGMILMNLELIPMPGEVLETACTDGSRIMMGIPFYASLDKEERLFVIAHEAWHCVLMHGLRCQTRNQMIFNIATDLEIHFLLQKEKMKEPYVLPHYPGWAGLSAEEIYERLMQFSKKSDTPTVSEVLENMPESGKDSKHIHGHDGGGFDVHVYAGQDMPNLSGEQTDAQGAKGNSQTSASASTGVPGDFHGKAQADASLPGDSLGKAQEIQGTLAWDKTAVEKIRRMVIKAAQVVERSQGTVPGHIQGLVEQFRKPELPWRDLLRQFVTNCYGGSRRWLPPERRHVFHRLYLPSYHSQRLKAVLAIDTSGSTTADLPQFFAELSGLLNSFGQYELTVIQCDAYIQHVENFSDAKRLPRNYQWQSFGHGGTSFVPVFNYICEQELKPDVFIYLTDGYGDAPEKPPKYPVLWILTSDGRKPAAWGRCLRLPKRNDGNL